MLVSVSLFVRQIYNEPLILVKLQVFISGSSTPDNYLESVKFRMAAKTK